MKEEVQKIADMLNQHVSIDKVIFDHFAVDGTSFKIIDRPCLSVAYDRKSEVVLGYHLSVDRKFSTMGALLLKHCLQNKERVFDAHPNIRQDCVASGITTLFDNLSEWNSEDMRLLCDEMFRASYSEKMNRGGMERVFLQLNNFISDSESTVAIDFLGSRKILWPDLQEMVHNFLSEKYQVSYTYTSTVSEKENLSIHIAMHSKHKANISFVFGKMEE